MKRQTPAQQTQITASYPILQRITEDELFINIAATVLLYYGKGKKIESGFIGYDFANNK